MPTRDAPDDGGNFGMVIGKYSPGSDVNNNGSSGAPTHDAPDSCVQIGGVKRGPEPDDAS